MTVWKYEKNHTMQMRLLSLAFIFLFIIFVLIGRLFYLQIFDIYEKNMVPPVFFLGASVRSHINAG